MAGYETYEKYALASKNALERIDNFEWFCATLCADISAWAYAHDGDPVKVVRTVYNAIMDSIEGLPIEGEELK